MEVNVRQSNSFNNEIIFSQAYYYNVWDNYFSETENLHSVTFKWCEFSQCKFVQTVFADSDWDSCKITNCNFKNINFENSDITSTYFVNCNFENACFKGASMTDITFDNCVFKNCDFNHVGLMSSIFESCLIQNLNLRQSTTSLNHYRNCKFLNAKINGNFLYNLFENVCFTNTLIANKLFSSNYGFTQNNLAELQLNQEELKSMQKACMDSSDIFSAAIISLNLEENNYDYVIWASVQIIINQLTSGILIRSEQLIFLKEIIKNLLDNDKISLYTILAVISVLEKLNMSDNIALKKSEAAINQLVNMLFEYYHKYVQKIDKELHRLPETDTPVELKITYSEEPAIPICTLLTQIMNSIGIRGPLPVREKTAKGSFIEWIQGYDNILKAIQLLISVLGLGISFKKTKSDQQAAPKETEVSPNCANTPSATNSVVFQIPQSVLDQLNVSQTEQNVSKTVNIFILNGVTFNNNFQGYNHANVRDIEIL